MIRQTSVQINAITERQVADLKQWGYSNFTTIVRLAIAKLWNEEVRSMASTWMFSCKLGLRQDDCERHESDPQARGHGRWDGCPSCVHRIAINAETKLAEEAFQRQD